MLRTNAEMKWHEWMNLALMKPKKQLCLEWLWVPREKKRMGIWLWEFNRVESLLACSPLYKLECDSHNHMSFHRLPHLVDNTSLRWEMMLKCLIFWVCRIHTTESCLTHCVAFLFTKSVTLFLLKLLEQYQVVISFPNGCSHATRVV